MAALALAAVGALASGAVGAASVGGTVVIGGLAVSTAALQAGIGLAVTVGQALLAEGPPDIEGPRLDDYSVPTASEGTPLKRVYGTMRVTGEVFWSLTRRETEDRQSGGKGPLAGGAPTVTTYSYLGTFAHMICAGPDVSIGRTWFNSELVDYTEFNYTFYDGAARQVPHAIIAAAEGHAPGEDGKAYIVFEELLLDPYGKNLPKVDYEVTRALPSPGLRGIIEAIAADYPDVTVDATGVTTDPSVTGYMVDRPMTFRQAIQPLQQFFRIDVVEQDGITVIRSRPDEPMVTIAAADLLAAQGEPPLRVTTATQRDLPRKTTLVYQDPSNDYQTASVRQSRQNTRSTSERQIRVPMGLDDGSARRLLTAAAMDAEAGRKTLNGTLSPAALETAVGDVIELTEGDQSYLAQITRQTWEWGMPFTAAVISGNTGRIKGRSSRRPLQSETPVIGAPVWFFLDTAMFTDDDMNPHRPWIAADADTWTGVSVVRDLGAGFTGVADVPRYAQIGSLDAPLSAGSAYGVLDDVNSITVTMRRNYSFDSVDPANLSNPINVLAIRNAQGEWEILQFATAVLVEGNTWTLSDLQRGRRGTEHAMSAPIGSPVIVLDAALVKLNLSPDQTGMALTYRIGPSGIPHDDDRFSEVDLSFAGIGLRPWSPVDLTAVSDMSGNVTLGWTERQRIPGDPESLRFTVRIYDGATVVREIDDIDGEETVYAATQIAADFGGPIASVDFSVTATNTAFGEGPAIRGTVTL